MLINQIIDFELGSLCCTCAPTTGYFHEKTKAFTKNLQLDYYLLLKYCRRQCILVGGCFFAITIDI